MYKISDDIKRLIMETMKNWKVELTTGRKTLAKVKIQRGIIFGNGFSPLLFAIAMITLNYILRKCSGRVYKITRKD